MSLIGFGIFVILIADGFDIEIVPEARPWLENGRFVYVESLLLMAVGPIAWVGTWRMTGLRVFVFPKGVAWVRRNQSVALRWEEIRKVRRVVIRNDHSHYHSLWGNVLLILTDQHGEEFRFSPYLKRLSEFREYVEQFTLLHLVPLALETIELGNTVRFGKLEADNRGVWYNGDCLPWAMAGEAEAAKGLLRITELSGAVFCELETEYVPNCHVLLALIEHYRGGELPSRLPDDAETRE